MSGQAVGAPLFAGPLVALGGTQSGFYRIFFTRLMQFDNMPPFVTAMIVLSTWTVVRARVRRDGAAWGWLGSTPLIALGLVFGSQIRGTGTLIPASSPPASSSPGSRTGPPRVCYEQAITNLQEVVCLWLVAAGGSISLAGGLLFVCLAGGPLAGRAIARFLPSRPAPDSASE